MPDTRKRATVGPVTRHQSSMRLDWTPDFTGADQSLTMDHPPVVVTKHADSAVFVSMNGEPNIKAKDPELLTLRYPPKTEVNAA